MIEIHIKMHGSLIASTVIFTTSYIAQVGPQTILQEVELKIPDLQMDQIYQLKMLPSDSRDG